MSKGQGNRLFKVLNESELGGRRRISPHRESAQRFREDEQIPTPLESSRGMR
jgi:hypothetical protein